MEKLISERIALIMNSLNLNKNSFSKKIGLNNNVTIGNIINLNRNPSYEIIHKILSAFPYINAEWLILGKGNMLKKDVEDVPEILARTYSVMEDAAPYGNSPPKENNNKEKEFEEIKKNLYTIIDTQKMLIESLQDQIELYKKNIRT